MARIFTGTMGFSYSDWARVFYPPGTKPGDYLSYYSRYFDTVELDTTFHAVPPVARVQRWTDDTPDDFRFCVKTPKAITHEGLLDRKRAEMDHFLAVMREFGPKLAVVLVQLPPSCGIDQFESLEHFLKGLPADLRFAVEFRNASWGQQRTLDLLREHKAVLVMAEYLSRPRRILLTSDFLYLRLIGQHERFEELNREQIDVEPSLQWWRGELDRVSANQKLENIWALFNNDFSGYAIETGRRFMRLMNLPVRQDPDQARWEDQEGSLFG